LLKSCRYWQGNYQTRIRRI